MRCCWLMLAAAGLLPLSERLLAGAFGVPTMYVTNEAKGLPLLSSLSRSLLVFHLFYTAGLKDVMFFGGDRLHFVEKALGNDNAQQMSLAPAVLPYASVHKPRVQFFFDLYASLSSYALLIVFVFHDSGSPWAFLGFTQLKKLQAIADVQLVPIVLGALFKQ